MLCRRGWCRLRGPVPVLGVDDDAGGTMIECLHHLALVERHPITFRPAIAVTADGIRAFLFLKFLARAKQP